MGTEIHWLGVLLAALAGFLIGGLWYGCSARCGRRRAG